MKGTGIILAAMAALSAGFGGGAASGMGMGMGAGDYDVPPILRREGKSRSYNSTPGGRAHKRWRQRRASGRA